MPEAKVAKGATVTLGRVDGRLLVGTGATLRAEDGKKIVVAGEARFAGKARVACALECDGLTVQHWGRIGTSDLLVTGDLEVHHRLDVSNSIEVRGAVAAEDVDVGGRIAAGSITCRSMRVGGVAEVSETLRADSVDVGGKIRTGGPLAVRDLQVGGRAEVGGGSATGVINVGGRFESTSKLEFEELRIFGVSSLAAGSKGKRVVASGRLHVLGDLECGQVEVHGLTSVSGDCAALRLDVSGKLEVAGSLRASEKLAVDGGARVGGTFASGELGVNGRFSAAKAVVAKAAVISGTSETKGGLKAGSVKILSGSVCKGPLVGETVEIGGSGPGWSGFALGQRLRIQTSTTRVEDVYASKVVVGSDSQVRRIFARDVEVGPGCDLEEVTYTGELKSAGHVSFAKPVRRVARLEEPPL